MVADWYVFCCQGRALTLIERGANRGAKYSQRHYPFTSFKGKKVPNIVPYNSGLELKSKQMFLMQGTQTLPTFTSTCFLLPLLLLLLCLCVQNESLQGVFSADQAETPIHQTGMCVLSLLTERMRGGGKTASELF